MYSLITCLKKSSQWRLNNRISISFLKMIGLVIKIATLKASISQSPEEIEDVSSYRSVYICWGKVDIAANKSNILSCKKLAKRHLKLL